MQKKLVDKYKINFEDENIHNMIKLFYRQYEMEDIFQHTLDVVNEIDKMVELSNEIRSKSKIAAYLHDIGRVVPKNQIVKLCEENGKEVIGDELKALGILHQFASKILAMSIFEIEDESILNSIECHTTLKSNPSEIDKIVFIADKLSWKEIEHEKFIEKLKEKLLVSKEEAIYFYQKDMYEKREAMACYHDLSEEAYYYFKRNLD